MDWTTELTSYALKFIILVMQLSQQNHYSPVTVNSNSILGCVDGMERFWLHHCERNFDSRR